VDGVVPPGYDCSGLMVYAWARAGVSLPHSSREQYRAGPHVPVSQARPGDLVFLATDPDDPTSIHHVALVYAPGQIIEAQTFGVPVHIRRFAGSAEPGIIQAAVRLAP
jgi:cell wall-associated NlpC family hydrolase